MKRKRIGILILCMMMISTMTSCGNNNGADKRTGNQQIGVEDVLQKRMDESDASADGNSDGAASSADDNSSEAISSADGNSDEVVSSADDNSNEAISSADGDGNSNETSFSDDGLRQSGLNDDAPEPEASEDEDTVLSHTKGTHHLSLVDEVPATCGQDGVKAYYRCDGCGRIFWKDSGLAADEINDKSELTIPALAHSLVKIEAVPATCEEPGRMEYYTCENCQHMYHDAAGEYEITDESELALPAKGHDWGDWVVIKEATETETGLEQRICRRDPSHSETRVIPVTGAHQLNEKIEQEPLYLQDFVLLSGDCGNHRHQ